MVLRGRHSVKITEINSFFYEIGLEYLFSYPVVCYLHEFVSCLDSVADFLVE